MIPPGKRAPTPHERSVKRAQQEVADIQIFSKFYSILTEAEVSEVEKFFADKQLDVSTETQISPITTTTYNI
jgi:hypothetical protein